MWIWCCVVFGLVRLTTHRLASQPLYVPQSPQTRNRSPTHSQFFFISCYTKWDLLLLQFNWLTIKQGVFGNKNQIRQLIAACLTEAKVKTFYSYSYRQYLQVSGQLALSMNIMGYILVSTTKLHQYIYYIEQHKRRIGTVNVSSSYSEI